MAHLMGLLWGMTAAKLQGLAHNWQIESTVEPRTLVSQLYTVMTDEQAVKFRYESLSPGERLLLGRILQSQKGWAPTRELESEFPFASVDLQMMLAGLDESGLVVAGPARVSPTGIVEGLQFLRGSCSTVQMTVARIAPEISSILLRIKAQVEAGDQSDLTLHKLLGGLTLPQLQELASRWRIPHQDQCFKRELILLVQEAIARRRCVEDTLSGLGEHAAIVFRNVCDAGGKMSVESLRRGSDLSEQSLRMAVSSLIRHFLVTETYVDGQRFLFTANGVARDDESGDTRELPDGSAGEVDREVVEPKKISQANLAFFFDLLVFTNLLETNDVELAGRDLRLPGWAVGQLKEELAVVAGSGFGPIRLDCLVRVASKLGLVGTRDDRVVPMEKLEEWIALGVQGQARALYELWLEDDYWCSEHKAYPIALDPAKYRCVRKRLLAALRRCKPGTWYRVDTISEAIIGNRAEADDGARVRAAAVGNGAAEYRELVRRVVALSLGTLLYWTGALSLGYDDGMEPTAVSVSGMGAWLFGGRAGGRRPCYRGEVVVLPNFEVMLHGADPEAWRWLLKLAVTVSVGRVSVHQITKRKVQQAVARGCSATEFVRFLVGRCREEVPKEVVAAITEWADGVKYPGSMKPFILEVDNAATMDRLIATAKYGKWISQRLTATSALVRELADTDRLVRDIRSEGFSLRVSR